MAKTLPMPPLLVLCLLPHFFLAKCSSTPLAPALYVFGDSLVDSGNNNGLNTSAKANYYPYGIDFPAGSTGRYTNGRTVADFLAKYLGLPFAPPFLGLSEAQKSETTTGMNYGSGSAGILWKSGKASGMNLALQTQIELFKDTVNHYLPKNFKSNNELMQYLSKSIFVIDTGGNDYLNNYLQPARYNSSQLYSPVQFAGIVLKKLQRLLEDLYDLGARKFLVFNIPPVGCIPVLLNSYNLTSGCVESVNQLISIYNEGLPDMLQELSDSLNCSVFVEAEFYAISYELNQNPSKYGFTTRSPCCVVEDGAAECLKDAQPCQDRFTHLYWDAVHPTQHANLLFATGCFLGSTQYCTPMNILQLTQKQ